MEIPSGFKAVEMAFLIPEQVCFVWLNPENFIFFWMSEI
jgi:hypothetical protein